MGVSYHQEMGHLRRKVSFLSFALRALLVVARTRHDVTFASSTPLSVFVPAVLAKVLRPSTRLVLEVRDLWPSVPIELGLLPNPIERWVARRLEKLAYRLADQVVALSPGMAREVVDKGGDAIVVPNGSDRVSMAAGAPAVAAIRERLGIPEGAPVVLYAGSIGYIHDPAYLHQLLRSLVDADSNVHAVVLGQGGGWAQLKERFRGEDRVHVLSRVPRSEIAAYFGLADLSLVTVVPVPLMETNSANKFFDSLAAGCPLAVNYGGWHAELLEAHDAGIRLSRHPAVGARQILEVVTDNQRADEMGKAALELSAEFEWDVLYPSWRRALFPTEATSTRPQVVHLSSVHPAGDTRVLHRECETLAHSGEFDVVLVARHDPSLDTSDMATRVIQLPETNRLGRLGRIVATARLGWSLDGDIYHVHDPELFPVAGLFRLMGRRTVIDIHEDLRAQWSTKSWFPRPVRAVLPWGAAALERLANPAGTAVVVANPQQHRPSERARVIQNFALLAEFADEPPSENGRSNLLYIGGVSVGRGLVEMLDAIAEVGPTTPHRLRIGGPLYPPQVLDRFADHPGMAYADYLGVLGRTDVVAEMRAAAIGLSLLRDTPNYRVNQPTKAFEYAAAGLPILASDLEGSRHLLESSQGIRFVPPGDGNAAASAVKDLFSRPDIRATMGTANRETFLESWCWETSEAPKLISLYRDLGSRSRQR